MKKHGEKSLSNIKGIEQGTIHIVISVILVSSIFFSSYKNKNHADGISNNISFSHELFK